MLLENNDKNQSIDAILVDFQLCFWGPAIVDLAHTIYTSSREELRAND